MVARADGCWWPGSWSTAAPRQSRQVPAERYAAPPCNSPRGTTNVIERWGRAPGKDLMTMRRTIIMLAAGQRSQQSLKEVARRLPLGSVSLVGAYDPTSDRPIRLGRFGTTNVSL